MNRTVMQRDISFADLLYDVQRGGNGLSWEVAAAAVGMDGCVGLPKQGRLQCFLTQAQQ